MKSQLIALIAILLVVSTVGADEQQVQLKISGGHETDPRDHGRPVALIGNALGVTPEIFREAFSRVKPAPAGREPEPAQVQRNKAALLDALGKHGVTNEQLDRVSNYYRYRPESGRLWPTKPAAAIATLKDGAITSIKVTESGSGYSTPPEISVPGHSEIALKATLAFGRDLKSNGAIASIAQNKPAQ